MKMGPWLPKLSGPRSSLSKSLKEASASAAAAGAAAGEGAPQSAGASDKPADDNVVDAEFTEVKEKK